MSGNLLSKLAETKEGGLAPFFKIAPDTKKLVRLLLDAPYGTAAAVHGIRFGGQFKGTYSCTGSQCPACQAEVKRTFRGWLMAWDYQLNEGKGGVTVFSGGQRMMKAVEQVYSSYKDATFRDLVVQRDGDKFDTKYTIYPAIPNQELNKLLDPSLPTDLQTQMQAILLGGHPNIKPVAPSAAVVEGVCKFFDIEIGVTQPANLFEAIRPGAMEIVEKLAKAPTNEEMAALLRGESINKSQEDPDDDEDSTPGPSVFASL